MPLQLRPVPLDLCSPACVAFGLPGSVLPLQVAMLGLTAQYSALASGARLGGALSGVT